MIRIVARAALACVLAVMTQMAVGAPHCADITGFERYALQAPGLVVSDMHGTVEAPAFLRDLVCHLLRADRAVLLALEYPAAEQPYLDALLSSHEPADRAEKRLLATPFWSRDNKDGRTSQAMLDLLLWVRQQQASGARIRLLAFDSLPPDAAAAFDERDAAMAATLSEALGKLAPGDVPVIFTGNVHARKTQGLPFVGAPPESADVKPLGYRLKDRGFVHLGIAYRGGSIWTCTAKGCGVQQGGEPGPAVGVFALGPSDDPAYDAVYLAGRLTASLPAVPADSSPPSQKSR